MSKPPRGLSPGEAALWARLAQTVKPIDKDPPRARLGAGDRSPQANGGGVSRRLHSTTPPSAAAPLPPPRGKPGEDLRTKPHTLDANWDRKLAKAAIAPDFTLDLHGHTLASAHARLDHGLTLALAQGARLVLLITGRPRADDDTAGRGERRGAIRAKFLDWLASGPHASRIAAVRPAHPRHGGAGAVYIVLRKER